MNYYVMPGLKHFRVRDRDKIDPQRIIEAVCDHFQATREQVMLTKNRKGPTVVRKQILIYLLRMDTTLSYPQIARVMGMHYSNVMHHVSDVKDHIFSQPDLWQQLEDIRSRYSTL